MTEVILIRTLFLRLINTQNLILESYRVVKSRSEEVGCFRLAEIGHRDVILAGVDHIEILVE